jgi:hypothetical protein
MKLTWNILIGGRKLPFDLSHVAPEAHDMPVICLLEFLQEYNGINTKSKNLKIERELNSTNPNDSVKFEVI